MNHKIFRTLLVACLALATFCLMSPAHAAPQPRMNKAVELLVEAKAAKNPTDLLVKAKTHVENTEPGDRGGRRFAAINKIEKAIAGAKKGKNVKPLIDEAIVLLQEGIEIKDSKKKG